MDDFNFNDEFSQTQPALQTDEKKGGSEQSAPKAKMGKRKKIIIAAGAVLLAVLFFLLGMLTYYYSIDSRARKLLWLIGKVDDEYYQKITDEEWDAVYDKLYDAVMPDIFCSYYSPDEYKKLVGESNGSNMDTGLAAVDDDGALRIYRIVGNSSAAHATGSSGAHMREGMQIYRFGTSAEKLVSGNRDAFYSMAAGSNGTVWIECGFSAESAQLYCVTSGKYLASYCTYRDSETSFSFSGEEELVLTDTGNPLVGADAKTAYISLSEFDGNADREFALLLQCMKDRGRENLIIDLRRNGGGYLSTFQSIASHLLKNAEGKSPLVAYAKYRSGSTSNFKAKGNDFTAYFTQNARVSILADERTASASECLIGALVDYGTVGFSDIYLRKTETAEARSYGKGVMQSAYVASDGSMVRITSAQIFWPKSGKTIHGKGITESDGAVGIVAPLLPEEQDEMLQAVIARLS